MKIWIGTSGFQYPEWKGSFYPKDISSVQMLSFYSERFATTEINYTFRRLPSDEALSHWRAQTPREFRFTLKALQRITDHRRLKNCQDLLEQFLAAARKLKSKRGALLFQLPPNFKCDLPVLKDFLALLPASARGAFEFRHPSWFNDEVFEALRKRKATLCIADSEKLTTPAIVTSSTGYFRLRRVDYTPRELRQWAKTIEEQSRRLNDVYVYFKHEERCTGPALATKLIKLLG